VFSARWLPDLVHYKMVRVQLTVPLGNLTLIARGAG
jgi:hypothetical protein